MQITSVQEIRKHSAVLDSEDLLIYTRYEPSLGTYIYRAIRLSAMGPLLQTQLKEKLSENRFIIEESFDGDWYWQVFFYEGEKLLPLVDFPKKHLSNAAHICDYIYYTISKHAINARLPLAKIECEVFIEATTASIRKLPFLSLRTGEFLNLNGLKQEIPEIYLQNFPPEILVNPKLISEPSSYMFLITSAMARCLMRNSGFRFYEEFVAEKLIPQFTKAVSALVKEANHFFYLPEDHRNFAVKAEDRVSDYQSFRNDLSVEVSRLDNLYSVEPNILSRINNTYYIGKLKSVYLTSFRYLFEEYENNQGAMLLIKGKSGTGKNGILDQIVYELKKRDTMLIKLTEQGRNFDVEKSPLYDVISNCLEVLSEKLESDSSMKAEFVDNFRPYLSFFSGLSKRFENCNFVDIGNLKGVGSFTDSEIFDISYLLLKFAGNHYEKCIIRIDGEYKLGISRAITNTAHFTDILNSLPVVLIATVNEGSSEFKLSYRLEDAPIKRKKIIELEPMSLEDIRSYLKVLGLDSKANAKIITKQLHNFSKGKISHLRDALLYFLRMESFSIGEQGQVEWDLEKLNPEYLPFDTGKVGLELIHSLSVEDLAMLKRLSLTRSSLPVSLLSFGIEHYGEAGARKLERVGLLKQAEAQSMGEHCFKLENSFIREEILSELDRKERFFLSIQLARAINESIHHINYLDVEAELWGNSIEKVKSDADRSRSLEAFVELARKHLAISDYRSAERYLLFAQRALTDQTVSDHLKSIEVRELIAIISFRLGDSDRSKKNFKWIIENTEDHFERVRIRNIMIELFCLYGDHELVRQLAEENFSDLKIEAEKYFSYKYLISDFWSAFRVKPSRYERPRARAQQDLKYHRWKMALETIQRSVASYYSRNFWDYVKLTVISKRLTEKVGESRYIIMSLLSDAITARVINHSIKKSKKIFALALEISRKINDPLFVARTLSVRELFQGNLLNEDKLVVENLKTYGQASFAAEDEIFYVYSELNRLSHMLLSGCYPFHQVYEEVKAFVHQCSVSNRREASLAANEIVKILDFACFGLGKEDGFIEESSPIKDSAMYMFFENLANGFRNLIEGKHEVARECFIDCMSSKASSYRFPQKVNLIFYSIVNLNCLSKELKWGLAKFKVSFELLLLRRKFFSLCKINPRKFAAKMQFIRTLSYSGKEKSKSVDGFEQALSLFNERKDHLGALISSNRIAQILVDDNQNFRASKYLEEALKSSDFLNFKWMSDKIIKTYSKGDKEKSGIELSQEVSEIVNVDNELGSVIKLVQDIGKDERVESSLQRVLEMIASSNGADRAIYLLPTDNEHRWEIVSLFDHGSVDISSLRPDQVKLNELFSVDVVNYCYELSKQVALADAKNDSSFKDDPYIQEYEVKSIFCLPVLSADGIIGVIYLENNRIANSFSGLSVEVPTLLASLAHSLHEKAELYNNMETKVVERTQRLRELQKELTNSAFHAGMAEVATETIHNLGNLLNSVSVESSQLKKQILDLQSERLEKLKNIIGQIKTNSNEDRIDIDMNNLVEYLDVFSDYLKEDFDSLETSSVRINERVGMIRSSIQSQQEFAKGTSYSEEILVDELMNQVIEMLRPQLASNQVKMLANIPTDLQIVGIRSKVAQVLLNLVKNSIDAVESAGEGNKTIRIDVYWEDEQHVVLSVRDSGIGISFEDQVHVFEYGFTTKDKGHGFGLHSVALMMEAMGGGVELESPGLGRGCEFRIKFKKTES